MRGEFKRWRQKRNQALARLDIAYARENCPGASSDEVLLLALHKARYNCLDIDPELRLQSKRWLAARGYRSMNGLPLLPGDELPR